MQKRLVWILALCVAVAAVVVLVRVRSSGESFDRAMAVGAGYLTQGDATNAVEAFSRAVKLAPESLEAHLNLANAFLLAGNNPAAIEQCERALALDHNEPAAYYLTGCAYLHLNRAEAAVQAFQQSQKIDPAVSALNFQLGLAQERLGHLDDAIQQFENVVQFDPDNMAAHYQLSRLYQRAGRASDAAQELAKFEQLRAKTPNPPSGPLAYERCKYTEPRIAFTLEEPDPHGIPVRFVDATASAFGTQAGLYRGPVGVLDYNQDGRNSLLVVEGTSFRLLDNAAGKFTPLGDGLPNATNGPYRRCLVGDLNNDRYDDVIMLGEQASQALRFATNGHFREVTAAAGLKGLTGQDGVLADLDFTGKLDLLAILPGGRGLSVRRDLGNFYFVNNTNSGLPTNLSGLAHLAVEDLNNEDVPGVLLTRAGMPPLFYAKQRAGSFVETNLTRTWPPASEVAVGDLNNDLREDCVLADEQQLHIIFGGQTERRELALNGLKVKGLLLTDYDNDGWLDVLAYGSGVRVWRNAGKAGFQDVTAALGLDKIGPVDSLVAADFDNDGAIDLIASTATGLQFWKNEGGNANKLLKLHLAGTRSNASALGVRVELASGHWHAIRTLNQPPLEIGIGKHDKIEVLKIRWFDLATTLVDLPWQPQPVTLTEPALPAGSCPYLYAWDGRRFRFVTDILGSSPLGLPVSATRFVEADPEEYLELGTDQSFPPKAGRFEVRVTEELREVLYLDEAKLVVVDHPAGTVVHPTSKMHAGRPFPPHALWTLRPATALRQAIRSDGLDVTKALVTTDGQMVCPVRLREPQLRGLAEPFAVTMDFGELATDRPLVLVLNGWLRFGGGMANIGAALDPTLPFPFPKLEAELPDGSWQRVETDVGVPSGKTKTILVDLDQKLPPGARRLRLSSAFELYWDSAALYVKTAADQNQSTTLGPDRADLHWRGFSQFADLPSWLPLTPEYEQVRSTPPWRRTPSGWCTRYGPVKDLVKEQDNALVLLNGGDEVALSFRADQLPPKPDGFARDFFLFVAGWDKDADFHVSEGSRVEPLPFLGLDDQAYGHQPRPPGLSDSWVTNYNTRWIGPMVLSPRQEARR